jgi:hypothetical protein
MVFSVDHYSRASASLEGGDGREGVIVCRRAKGEGANLKMLRRGKCAWAIGGPPFDQEVNTIRLKVRRQCGSQMPRFALQDLSSARETYVINCRLIASRAE